MASGEKDSDYTLNHGFVPGEKIEIFKAISTVKPPCTTAFYKQLSIQNTKIFSVKALQLEPLVNNHLL